MHGSFLVTGLHGTDAGSENLPRLPSLQNVAGASELLAGFSRLGAIPMRPGRLPLPENARGD